MKSSIQPSRTPKDTWSNVTLPRAVVVDECEAKYFLTKEQVTLNLRLAKLHSSNIRQDYLDEQAFQEIVPAILRANGLDTRTDFRQGRLRFEKTTDEESCLVELKGPREDWHRRTEVTIPISPDFYHLLRQFAHGGTLEKVRYYLPLTVTDGSKAIGKAEAHIDFIVGAGRKNRFSSESSISWCTIDIESSPLLLPHVRRGNLCHAWIVQQGIELIRDGSSSDSLAACQRALSNKRLAREGFDKDAAWAVEKLSRKLRRR